MPVHYSMCLSEIQIHKKMLMLLLKKDAPFLMFQHYVFYDSSYSLYHRYAIVLIALLVLIGYHLIFPYCPKLFSSLKRERPSIVPFHITISYGISKQIEYAACAIVHIQKTSSNSDS